MLKKEKVKVKKKNEELTEQERLERLERIYVVALWSAFFIFVIASVVIRVWS